MAPKTTKKSAKKSKKKKTSKGFLNKEFLGSAFRFSLKWGFVAALWCALIIGAILLWYARELPNITKAMVFERRPTITIKASNGEIVDRYGDIKGEIVDVKNLPPHIINAILATEDRRFYSHFGMDLRGFTRAVAVNVKQGGFVQGGSTITQQLAKNLFLTRDRTLKRKIQELILSFQLERELTKDEILSAYLNRVYLGSGAYGLDAAANVYFGKPAKSLNLRESAVIAGLLKAPSRYSPNSNPELSAQRTKVVMQSMVDAGYIEQSELEAYKKIPPTPRRKPSSGNSVRYFTDYIISQLDDLIGTIDQDVIVETTLDVAVQREMEEAITKAILRYGPEHNAEQAASLFMRNDGAVISMMGGRNYSTSEYNRATDALRQPGSSFKPFVYLTAIESGMNMYSQIEDKKVTSGRYRPKNFGGLYYGWVSLEKALTKSLNTVAVSLMRKVGASEVIDTARRLGITADLEPNLSTALGSSAVPMIQMVTAYTTLARGGSAVDPYSIKRIKDKQDNVLYERTAPSTIRRVIEPNDVAQINSMMRSVVEAGTGTRARIPYPAAGKTGTTQDYRDAWFIGFTNRYTGAVWFGNDDNSPMKKLTGGSAPASVWKEVMIKAQTRGGKAYNTFAAVDTSKFKRSFGGLMDGGESDGSWFDNMFNGIEQDPEGRSLTQKELEYRKKQEDFKNRQKQYKQPEVPNMQVPEDAPKKEFSPLGRHQWDLNE